MAMRENFIREIQKYEGEFIIYILGMKEEVKLEREIEEEEVLEIVELEVASLHTTRTNVEENKKKENFSENREDES